MESCCTQLVKDDDDMTVPSKKDRMEGLPQPTHTGDNINEGIYRLTARQLPAVRAQSIQTQVLAGLG